jgi:hypothetical protein
MAGAARTRTPSITNYDVHSTTWVDGKPALLRCAMEATDLGHEPSWSLIDPVQVSAFLRRTPTPFIASPSIPCWSSSLVGLTILQTGFRMWRLFLFFLSRVVVELWAFSSEGPFGVWSVGLIFLSSIFKLICNVSHRRPNPRSVNFVLKYLQRFQISYFLIMGKIIAIII